MADNEDRWYPCTLSNGNTVSWLTAKFTVSKIKNRTVGDNTYRDVTVKC